MIINYRQSSPTSAYNYPYHKLILKINGHFYENMSKNIISKKSNGQCIRKRTNNNISPRKSGPYIYVKIFHLDDTTTSHRLVINVYTE